MRETKEDCRLSNTIISTTSCFGKSYKKYNRTDSNSSGIRQKGESQNGCFKKAKHVLCFLETPVLRFALLPYYRGIILRNDQPYFDSYFCCVFLKRTGLKEKWSNKKDPNYQPTATRSLRHQINT